MDQELGIIEYYKNASLEDLLLIKPFWAYGVHSNKMYRKSLRKSSGEFRVALVETEILIRNIQFEEVDHQVLFPERNLMIKE